ARFLASPRSSRTHPGPRHGRCSPSPEAFPIEGGIMMRTMKCVVATGSAVVCLAGLGCSHEESRPANQPPSPTLESNVATTTPSPQAGTMGTTSPSNEMNPQAPGQNYNYGTSGANTQTPPMLPQDTGVTGTAPSPPSEATATASTNQMELCEALLRDS